MATAEQEWIAVPCSLCGSERLEPLFEKLSFRHVRCKECNLVFVSPLPRALQVWNDQLYSAEHGQWGDFARTLVELRGDAREKWLDKLTRFPAPRYRSELDGMERYRQRGRLLDVGCSAGRFLLSARGRGWECHGVEPAATNAEVGRAELGLDIRIGRLEEAGFEDQFFDVVRANQVIEHIADPRSFLTEIARVLRPGGLVILSTVNFRSWTRRALGVEWRHLGSPAQGHVVFFDPNTLRKALDGVGIQVCKVRTMGFRLCNPSGSKPPRWRRTLEKLGGALAAPLGRGGRMRVFAERRA